MTSQSNTPPPSLHFLLQRICSTALNSSTSTKRNELLQTIDQRLGLKHDDDCNDANNNDADGNSETAVEKTVVIKFASGGLGLKAGVCMRSCFFISGILHRIIQLAHFSPALFCGILISNKQCRITCEL